MVSESSGEQWRTTARTAHNLPELQPECSRSLTAWFTEASLSTQTSLCWRAIGRAPRLNVLHSYTELMRTCMSQGVFQRAIHSPGLWDKEGDHKANKVEQE